MLARSDASVRESVTERELGAVLLFARKDRSGFRAVLAQPGPHPQIPSGLIPDEGVASHRAVDDAHMPAQGMSEA
jgi:hypothetical protein